LPYFGPVLRDDLEKTKIRGSFGWLFDQLQIFRVYFESKLSLNSE